MLKYSIPKPPPKHATNSHIPLAVLFSEEGSPPQHFH